MRTVGARMTDGDTDAARRNAGDELRRFVELARHRQDGNPPAGRGLQSLEGVPIGPLAMFLGMSPARTVLRREERPFQMDADDVAPHLFHLLASLVDRSQAMRQTSVALRGERGAIAGDAER